MNAEDIKALSTLQILGCQIKDLVKHIDDIQDENDILKDEIMKYKRFMKLSRYFLIVNGVLCSYAMSHIFC